MSIHHSILKSHIRTIPKPFRLLKPQTDTKAVCEYLDRHHLPILAHSLKPSPAHDPKLIFANEAAHRLFQFGEKEMLGLPSRLLTSKAHAGAVVQRRNMFKTLEEKGFWIGQDEWMSREGFVFTAKDCVMWNIVEEGGEGGEVDVDGSGAIVGQAAAFIRMEHCPWFYHDAYHLMHLDEA
ncbi:hypothetical protein HDU98_010508 [Podochytrium sp. JEL0797]|nr:hypothetical protein HDU98_010508 [Podochytrium sp. JEL0797]